MNILKVLSKICSCKRNQKLKDYCSIKIGGVAKFICFPKTIRQLKKLVAFLNKNNIRFFVLGNGTNVVFSSNGFNGVIICLKKLNKIFVKKNKVSAFCGASLFYLNQLCENNGLSGLEFSYGIPATVGGAVVMNAGAFGGEMKDIIQSVLVLQNNRVKLLKKEQICFSHRKTSLQNKNIIVLKATFSLKKANNLEIKQKQQLFFKKRLNSQPYGTNNAGSVFKRVNGESAGKYIDKLGLKGVTIGGIEISSKHANFFVNKNGATSQDYLNAISFVKQSVKKEFCLNLEEEIIYVGE